MKVESEGKRAAATAKKKSVAVKDRRPLWKRPRSWIILGLIVIGVFVLERLGFDRRVVAAFAILAGLLTQAFAIVVGLVALVPVIGPLIATLLTLPIFWFINATSHVLTALAVKQGYGRQMASSKLLVLVLMIGLILGFLIGHWTA